MLLHLCFKLLLASFSYAISDREPDNENDIDEHKYANEEQCEHFDPLQLLLTISVRYALGEHDACEQQKDFASDLDNSLTVGVLALLV